MNSFRYNPSIPVHYWGYSFDSLLELKYAISIQDDYYFLRARIPIYYNPKTKIPTDYLRENSRRYTPDFLIRHKQTKKAWWVEIKPRAFDGEKQLALRKEIAEKYIRWKSFDWSYTVIYADQVRLTPEQQKQFDKYCQFRMNRGPGNGCQNKDTGIKDQLPSFFKNDHHSLTRFVMFGH